MANPIDFKNSPADVGPPQANSHWFDQVRSQLGELLASPQFKGKDRSQRLLRYLVEECLQGRAAGLKQYSIALDVFGRDADFDPRVDPVVRTEAAKLRRALAEYNAIERQEDRIRFEIPKGAYLVTFQIIEQVQQARATNDKNRKHYRKPRIAVLPVENLNADPNAELFAIGFAHGLITALAEFQSIEVIGHHTVNQFRGKNIDLRTVAAELDVDLFVGSNLRWAADRFRLSVALTDATRLTTVWSETHDRRWSTRAIFDLEEEISAVVSARLASRYATTSGSIRRAACAKPFTTEVGYNAVRAYNAQSRDHAHFGEARAQLRAAAQAEPDNALVLSMHGEIEFEAALYEATDDHMDLEAVLAICERAAALDPNCQEAMQTLAYTRLRCRHFKVAKWAYNRCIELDPNAAQMRAFCGWGLALAGDWERGLAHLDAGRRLNACLPSWLNLAPLYYAWRQGDFEEAYRIAHRTVTPGVTLAQLIRIATAVRLGKEDEARANLDDYKANHPELVEGTIWRMNLHTCSDELADEFGDALVKAGL